MDLNDLLACNSLRVVVVFVCDKTSKITKQLQILSSKFLLLIQLLLELIESSVFIYFIVHTASI